jgi:predicted acyltransferase
MILVDDAGGEWPMIGHAPWNGCNLADFVMPFFLFIVGMSIALALKVGLYTVSIQLKKKVIGNGYWYAFILVSSLS